MYCVMVGDIIKSRDYKDEARDQLDRALEEVFAEINYRHRQEIFAPFGAVRGDSFEGILFSPRYALTIIREIQQMLMEKGGFRARICAVEGELSRLSTDRNKADGEPFHRAVETLEAMRTRKSDHWFQVSIQTDGLQQPLMDVSLMLLSNLTETWTDRQRELVWLYDFCGGQQKQMVEILNIRPNAVSKQLKAARCNDYYDAVKGIGETLNRLEEENENNNIPELFLRSLDASTAKNYVDIIPGIRRKFSSMKGERSIAPENLVPFQLCLAELLLEAWKNDKKPETEVEIRGLLNEIEKNLNSLSSASQEWGKFRWYLLNEECGLCFEPDLEKRKKQLDAAGSFNFMFTEGSPFYLQHLGLLAEGWKQAEEYEKARDFYRKRLCGTPMDLWHWEERVRTWMGIAVCGRNMMERTSQKDGFLYLEKLISDKQHREKEILYREAVEAYRRLTEENREYLSDLAGLCHSYGNFCAENGKLMEAETQYREALAIYRRLAEENPDIYLRYVAGTCNNYGNFCKNNGKLMEAEPLYREALDIRRRLAKKNPNIYLRYVANTCHNYGNFCKNNGKPMEAEPLYRKALEIYRRLAEENPDAYLLKLANTCNDYGDFCKENNKPKEAKALYREALEIRRQLEETMPENHPLMVELKELETKIEEVKL